MSEIFYLITIGLTLLVASRFLFPKLFKEKSSEPVEAKNFKLINWKTAAEFPIISAADEKVKIK